MLQAALQTRSAAEVEPGMYTLGINAAYHDSSACLVQDGIVIAAAEEERFTRAKHAKRATPFTAYELPFLAIDFCLRQAGIQLNDVHHVGYSFAPSLYHTPPDTVTLPVHPSAAHPQDGWESPWSPLFYSYLVNAPRQLAGGAPHHVRERFEGARHDGPWRWHFVPHHLAHAASAFLPSPFEEAAVLVLDGRGEKATTTYWTASGSRLSPLQEVHMPHSLGLLYEQVTEYLGFLPSSDEYKVMALASYGRPRFAAEFRRMVRVLSNGCYAIGATALAASFGEPRRKGAPLEERHFDLAASLQQVLEETVLCLVRWLHSSTDVRSLCLAGGVALNCVMNARLRDEGPFEELWVQPAAGDAGTALGAALVVDADARRDDTRPWRMRDAYLGPAYSDDEIEELMRWAGVPYCRPASLVEKAAELLAAGRVLGWFQGRMEFGPRALGARSILASPLLPWMKERMNDIKGREEFRPVAPVVLAHQAAEWFHPARPSPFMLFVDKVAPGKEDVIPSAVHIDGTARIQTIQRERHPLYYDLIAAFARRTGVPVLINTSFNTRSQPIVATPRDALESFWTTPLDALAIGPFLLEKKQ
ncbi:MAG: carbamoyltransferase C-terminal domain-containing protein [Bryobacteraceae bacterium]|nr:carbamoyltransferase C-terminal domain-containing protein [Bryobacteraceae bacterium]